MKSLKELGLTSYEAMAYNTLVERGNLAAKEVASYSGVPITRIFDVLRSLQQKGFLSIINVKPMNFQSIQPEIAIKNYISKKIESMEELEKEYLMTIKKKEIPKVEKNVITVSGFENVFNLMADLTINAKNEVLILSSAGEIRTPKSMQIASIQTPKHVSICKFITGSIENRQRINYLKKFGWKMKYFKLKGYSLALIDKKITAITVKNPVNPKDRIASVFYDLDLSRSMREHFLNLWKKAKRI